MTRTWQASRHQIDAKGLLRQFLPKGTNLSHWFQSTTFQTVSYTLDGPGPAKRVTAEKVPPSRRLRL